jgi:arsenate reductase (thioredoxin)
MDSQVYHVLFLCTGNSARSIMAEAILNQLGRGLFQAYSAGAHPAGKVNPLALAQLEQAGYPTGGYRSKSWDEFSGRDARPMDFVFTLCDKAGKEACAMLWPGEPITAAWGISDPAAVEGTEEERTRAFRTAFLQLQTRISLFLALPLDSIDRMSLQRRLMDIGTPNT